MPNEPSRLVYDFQVNIEILTPPYRASVSMPTRTPSKEDSELEKRESTQDSMDHLVLSLNENSEEIAEDIQHEIRKVIPGCTSQVIIFFYEGSLIALGTAVLLFLQPIVVESAKKALEPEITKLLQFAIKRVLPRWLESFDARISAPIEVDVSLSPTSIKDEKTTKTEKDDASPQSNNLISQRYLMPLMIANSILLLILIILLVSIVIPHLTFR